MSRKSLACIVTVLLGYLHAEPVAALTPSSGSWVANAGQWHESVVYAARTSQTHAFVLQDGEIRLQLPNGDGFASLRLEDAELAFQSRDLRPTRYSYFLHPNPERWVANQPGYAALAATPYPGVALSLDLVEDSVEFIFSVAPHTDPNIIRFRSDSGPVADIAVDGELVLRDDEHQSLMLRAPIAWQTIDGVRHDVAIRWRLDDSRGFGFDVGDFDPAHALMIDPLVRTTHLGGSGEDSANLFEGPNGTLYLVGSTTSLDLATTPGALQGQPTTSGDALDLDVLLATVSPDLTTFTQITYLGGTGSDFPPDVIFADNGDLVMLGMTASDDFPGVAGGLQATYGGGPKDFYIARVSPDLDQLVQASYFGGSGDEVTSSTFIQASSGNTALINGGTSSPTLPGIAGGAQSVNAGGGATGVDGFVARISMDLTSVVQSTFLGGDGDDSASVFPNGDDVYVAGFTGSTNFPGMTNAAQPTFSGSGDVLDFNSFDVYVSRLSSDLKTLLGSTYLGGSSAELDISLFFVNGEVIANGSTGSDDLQGISGGFQNQNAGGTDGYIYRLSADLSTFLAGTYVGGSGNEALGIILQTDALMLVGFTNSADFPGPTGAQPVYGGAGAFFNFGDAVLALVEPDLSAIRRFTYLGGSDDDTGGVLGVLPDGDLLMTIGTQSPDLPARNGGAQETFAGDMDIGIARLSPDLQDIRQTTYLGGSGREIGGSFVVRGDQLFVAGSTTSSDLLKTAGAAQPANAGGQDGFVAQLTIDLRGDGATTGTAGPLVAAVLPGSRAVRNGATASVFGVVINTGTGTATACLITPLTSVDATFEFQTTDPATNLVTGTPNTPVDIPAGQSQTFVLRLTPNATFPATTVEFSFDCDNTEPAAVTPAVNTLDLVSTANAGPDVIAISLTPSGDGVARITSLPGATAVAVATANVGTTGTVTVRASSSQDLGLTIFICETDAATAQCLAPPAPDVTTTIAADATTQFSVFLNASEVIALDAAANRVVFTIESAGTQVGSTSFAVTAE